MRYIKSLIVVLALGVMLAMPQAAKAISLGGSDWTLDIKGTFNVHFLGVTQDLEQTGLPVTITQSSNTAVTIPLTFPDPLSSLVLTPTGTVGEASPYLVTASTHLDNTGPITLQGLTGGAAMLNGSTIELRNVNASITGTVTQNGADAINIADLSGGFGPRGYYITGNAKTNAMTAELWTLNDGEDPSNDANYAHISNPTFDIASWSASRSPTAAPEPGTLAILLTLAAGVGGYWRWSRR